MTAPELSQQSGKTDSQKKALPRKRRAKPVWLEYLEAGVVAVVLALLIRTFLFQAFRIPTGSMEDTLLVGDYLFVNKFLYGAEIPFTGHARLPGIRDPQRGDIIVFRYPKDPSQDYIKRCVALPGDTVEYRDKVLYVNGEPQDEDYVKLADGSRMSPGRDNFGPVVVPEDKFFMMGDNRDRSSDSRFWGFLDRELIRGKAMFIYFSWDSSRSLPRFGRIFDWIH
jgi:signal peptidase I